MSDDSEMFSALDLHELIEMLAERLQAMYVFPELATQIGQYLRERQKGGAYDAAQEPTALATALTADLQIISGDKHMVVRWNTESAAAREEAQPTAEIVEEWNEYGRLNNWGFTRVERLPGNIGYIEIQAFYPAFYGGDAAVHAMNLVAETGALIFDVRLGTGGDPTMIQLVTSYLFGREPIHLNSLYRRATDSTQQWWTMSYVPGPRFGSKSVYVLTSHETFSGCEEFAYNLQQVKRATVVGETTGGGAHPGRFFPVTGHFEVFIPVARAINPISGTNWEGTGVQPDIPVPADQALEAAYERALRDVLSSLPDTGSLPQSELRREAEQALAALHPELRS